MPLVLWPKGVTTMKPQNPGVPKPSPGKVYDPLEPMPLPDVVESDSDTAWGLWQDSLQTPDSEPAPEVPARDAGYDDTVPMDITELEQTRKPDR